MSTPNQLYILWTNADPITAEKMVLMYGINAKLHYWWETVTLIIWGAPVKLVAENALIQEKVKQALQVGVTVSACKACADQLGLTQKLEEIGVEVKYWGEPFTQLLKDNEKLIVV